MRQLTLLVMIVGLISFGCDSADVANVEGRETKTGDSASLIAVIDGFHNSFKSKNLGDMNAHFAEDGLFVGTDPGEFWTRKQLNDYLEVAFRGDTSNKKYSVTKREIEMNSNKTSAVVIDQFTLDFSPQMPIRSVVFADYVNDKWIIRMLSWNFIANNSDVDRLNETLRQGVR